MNQIDASNKKYSVIIVEDNIPTKQRMEKAINSSTKFNLVGSSTTVAHGKELLLSRQPDILLTDLDLPDGNGTELIELIQIPIYETKLAIVISVFGDEERVIKALKAGASGYLLKDDPFFEIEQALEQMLLGGSPISPSIARYLLNAFSDDSTQTHQKNNRTKIETLSDREREILILITKGLTAKEISSHLNISHHTVSSHIKKTYKKLSVNSKAQAIIEASKHGLI